jgi:fructosamine-3-kinase
VCCRGEVSFPHQDLPSQKIMPVYGSNTGLIALWGHTTHLMLPFPELEVFTKELFLSALRAEVQAIEPIVGVGSVNDVLWVKTNRGPFILRMNEGAEAPDQYAKEAWSIKAARSVSIPTPDILFSGDKGKYVYQIQQFARGINVSKLKPPLHLLAWYNCGRYVARFADIRATGFGDKVEDGATGKFSDSWDRYLTYNLEELTKAGDPLLECNHLSLPDYQFLRSALEQVPRMQVVIGLVHGDLHGRNFLQYFHQTYLLDWGTAERHVYPHVEIARLLAPGVAGVPRLAFRAFQRGLGVSDAQLAKMLPDVKRVHLLKSLDTYRWAFDHQESVPVDRYVKALNQAVRWAKTT